jgi:hypothetical protein
VTGTPIELSMDDLREVARYAAGCAQRALATFEDVHPDDDRPRLAIDAAQAFANGGSRSAQQRTAAIAANRAGRDARTPAAAEAARAAGAASASAYLHPLANATQVRHILGAAAYAAHAAELAARGDPAVGAEWIERARRRATPALTAVLRRYPNAPDGGTRVAQLLRALDGALRT